MTRQGQESEGFKAPGFTRQHFQLIAEVLAAADRNDTALELAWAFADRLLDENPYFDHDRFIDVATGKKER